MCTTQCQSNVGGKCKLSAAVMVWVISSGVRRTYIHMYMYIYIYMYIHVCLYVFIYTHISVYEYMHIVYTYVHIFTCMYVCGYTPRRAIRGAYGSFGWKYADECTAYLHLIEPYVHIYIHRDMYIHIHIYTYTHTYICGSAYRALLSRDTQCMHRTFHSCLNLYSKTSRSTQYHSHMWVMCAYRSFHFFLFFQKPESSR